MSSRDPLRVTLWAAGLILVALLGTLRPDATGATMRATAGPFGTLTAIIAASALASRLDAFRILSRALVPERGPRVVVLPGTGFNAAVALAAGSPRIAARALVSPAGRIA